MDSGDFYELIFTNGFNLNFLRHSFNDKSSHFREDLLIEIPNQRNIPVENEKVILPDWGKHK
ncbi:hypothetical protein ACM40_05310 [Chryseobacterium sp. BLS98]|nr:hypothetical protein ACM40_05310 [Chryseobacterium sp. BLS98]